MSVFVVWDPTQYHHSPQIISIQPSFGPFDSSETARGIESHNLWTYSDGHTVIYASSSIKPAWFADQSTMSKLSALHANAWRMRNA